MPGQHPPAQSTRDEIPAGRRAAADRRRQGIRIRIFARLGGQGVLLLGVRAVIAESFERIHRTNLVGMGVLPLEFQPGENAASLQVKAPVLPIRVSECSAPTQLIRAQSKSTRPQKCSSWSGFHPPGGFAPTNAIHAANVLRNEGSRVACARTEGRGVEVES